MESQGDQKKLSALFIGQRSALVRMLSRVVGCASQAEDLAQESYLKVAKALCSRPIEHLHPFLYQTAQYLAFDHLRSVRSKKRFECQLDDSVVVEVPTSAPGPDVQVQSQQQLQQFQRVLGSLPLRQQQILVLHRLQGLSQGEIAERLQVSLSTVEKDLRNALNACAKAIDLP
ncbi:ECF family RNA polymerase sigma factor [Pseudomonas reidholzensis]|uniref:ECF family RNA polymerase sigma factor n=1 Tax=Pseudomonas reidholzensis TaxID=1785162 RepID=A0A383RNV3_9PSED|nr:RNA polymerase sigma factor [Pseudomonas reidholzensis]SYX88453.1 ECF family RNA polymerase sigma factor [Pseudomonas reidholzensis]